MLTVSDLSVQFGGFHLFEGVSFSVSDGERIALIGRNGAGKTTLLKIISGHETAQGGNISKPNEFKIGYLPQDGKVDSNLPVFEEASLAMVELKQIESEVDIITKELEIRTDYESKEYLNLIQRLNHINERAYLLGKGKAEAKIEQVLSGLGFVREEFDKPVSQFSGGWQMRVELAKILLSNPDLILLDEPTNHLDIESIYWLENFLRNYQGAIMIVSHDSRFLDTVTNRTIEISKGKIFDMNLPYKAFLITREEQREQVRAAQKNQLRKIAETERFIERFRSKATLATRVQSRIKQLEKIERIEVEEEDLSSIKLKFPEAPRSSRLIVELNKLSKYYGKKQVLSNIDFSIERGDKIAFVGKNGEGKTTLSKILARIEDFDGEMDFGNNIEIGYYAQHQAEMLEGNSTVFETIDAAAQGEIRTQIRSLLGAFLFSGDSVYKKVKVLSGGEKSRLALCKHLLQPMNFLILDEPTNHLDVSAKKILKNALMDYSGSLIIVSHDRDFLDGLTTKTVEFKGGKIRVFEGSIEEYLTRHNFENLQELEKSASLNKDLMQNAGKDKLEREKQKQYQREENKILRQIKMLEEEIESIEASLGEMDSKFANPEFYSDTEKSKQLSADYKAQKEKLNTQFMLWEQLNNELEHHRRTRN